MSKVGKRSSKGSNWGKGVLIFIILSSLFLIGCTKKGEEPVDVQPQIPVEEPGEVDQEGGTKDELPTEEKLEDSTTKEEENATNEEENATNEEENATIEDNGNVLNNGGLYVKHNGKVYYRQYTADSYASEGIFSSYDSMIGAENNMMSISEDGTIELVFQDTGQGPIFISKGRMFLERLSEDYVPIVYSVDLEGNNEEEHGKGRIKAIDEETGTLVLVLANADNEYQLYQIDGASRESKPYELEIPVAEFLALKEGVIYYRGHVEYEASQLGQVKLCRVDLDGTKEQLLAETEADLYDFGDRGAIVPCIQFVGEEIYFAFGGYAGTGNFYQGGKIAKVKKDGSDFVVLLGDKESEEDYYANLVDEIFYVASENGIETLYYSKNVEGKFALNLSTGEIKDTDFPIFAEGKPFEYEGGIRIYLNASPSMTTWISHLDYNFLELEEEADYLTIRDIELVDHFVYYRLEANKEEPNASIGWRVGYRRMKTRVIREDLEGEVVEILFEY